MNHTKKLLKITCFIFFTFCSWWSLTAQVIYVNVNGSGNGTSWSDAMPDLAEAINRATIGTQIWVAAGTYYPTQCTECTIEDRRVSFEIPNGVRLIGGFASDSPATSDRDWQNNPTILSGNIDRDDTPTFNSYNVIYTKDVDSGTTIDGFIVTEGNANSLTNNGARSNSGAGWYNESSPNNGNASPVVSNCIFRDNHALSLGGAMHNEGGFGGTTNILFNNCQFENNSAGQAGGAVYNQASFMGANTSKFSNCHFINNHAEVEGGAIFSNGSEEGRADIEIVSCNFENNHTNGRGGAIYNRGSNNGHCNATLIGCNFTNNQAVDGGAIFNDGGFSGESSPILTGCYFKENKASGKGGAVINDGNFGGHSNPILTNCTFDKNTAEGNGGGVFSDGSESGDSHPTFENCQFFSNEAYLGGATYQFGKNGACEPIFKQCIFVNNQAEEGAGLYNDASFNGRGNFVMENCRFSNNHSISNGGAMYNLGTAGGEIIATLTNCTFDNNFSGFAGAGMFNSGIEGNCSPILTNCKFISNFTDTYGGAIYNQGKSGNASPTLINCLFSKNTAFSAGGIYNLGAEFGNSSPIITNCTFYGNRAHVGGAVYSNAAEENIGTAAPQITNCIFYKNFANFGDVFRIINGNPTLNYCQFDKPNCESLYSGIDGQVTCGEGLIFQEAPMFVDTATGNFHLQENAPGIDRGDNSVIMAMDITTDLDNHPRIQNGRVDLGVYEIEVEDNETIFTVTSTTTNQNLCGGMNTELSIIAMGTAPFFYQWFQNQNAIPAATSAMLFLENVNEEDSGSYYCRVINAAGDTLNSDLIQVNVSPEIAVSATIFVENDKLCAGTDAYFWAQTAGGGETPTYDWQINGISQNSNANTFIGENLADNDVVNLRFVSSENCPSETEVLSEEITMQISPNLTAAIAINADNDAICAGETVAFAATTENAGDAPIYQWFLNDTPVGANASTFTTTINNTTDEIRCQLTSSLTCVEHASVLSEISTVAVTERVQPHILISTDSLQFCVNSNVTFTAETEHGGDTPFYQWSVNNIIVSEGEAVFTTDNLTDGDVVNCLLISSADCVMASEVISNSLAVEVINCTTAVHDNELTERILLAPNPAREIVQIELPEGIQEGKYQIYNLQGKLLLQKLFQQTHLLQIPVTQLATGSYLVQLHLEQQLVIKKLILNR